MTNHNEKKSSPIVPILLAAALLASAVFNVVLGSSIAGLRQTVADLEQFAESEYERGFLSAEAEINQLQMEVSTLRDAANLGPNPIVTIEMEDGQIIRLELFPEMAPNTVTNFVYLAEQGFYNGTVFHRLIPGFMIQGGCPEGTGMGSPGYTIRGEFPANGFMQNRLLHVRGVISMARAQPLDSAGSQFFIMHDDAPFLDQAGYAAFGRVIEGIEVVDDIVMDPTTGPPSDTAISPRVMRSVTVETFGINWGEPEKLPSLR